MLQGGFAEGYITELSFPVDDKLRLRAVDAVAANEDKSRISNDAVTYPHIGKFNLCAEIDLAVIEKAYFSAARQGIRGKMQGLINVNIPAKRLANTGKLPKSCIMKVLPQAFFVSGQLLYLQFL